MPSRAGQTGLSRKLWTTRDLQEAAAAGALVEVFESDEVEDFESDVVVEVVLFEEDERLSVR